MNNVIISFSLKTTIFVTNLHFIRKTRNSRTNEQYFFDNNLRGNKIRSITK